MAQRNKTIDLAKYIASLMVIAIHVRLFEDVNETLDIFVVDILCRLAVPFFAICSGYFMQIMYKNASATGAEEKGTFLLWQHWRKIIRLYFVWTMVYVVYVIPTWIRVGWFSAWSFVDYAIATVKSGSYYHLWYLLSLLYAIPFFIVLLRYMTVRLRKWLIISLWIVKAVSSGYLMFLPDKVQQLISKLMLWKGMYDAVFCILPLLLLGAAIYDREQKQKKSAWINVCFCISFALLIVEVAALKSHGQDKVSYIFTTLPASYFLFQIILGINIGSLKKPIEIVVRQSTFIYCFHQIAIQLCGNWLTRSTSKWLAAAISSTLAGICWYNIKNVRLNRKQTK